MYISQGYAGIRGIVKIIPCASTLIFRSTQNQRGNCVPIWLVLPAPPLLVGTRNCTNQSSILILGPVFFSAAVMQTRNRLHIRFGICPGGVRCASILLFVNNLLVYLASVLFIVFILVILAVVVVALLISQISTRESSFLVVFFIVVFVFRFLLVLSSSLPSSLLMGWLPSDASTISSPSSLLA